MDLEKQWAFAERSLHIRPCASLILRTRIWGIILLLTVLHMRKQDLESKHNSIVRAPTSGKWGVDSILKLNLFEVYSTVPNQLPSGLNCFGLSGGWSILPRKAFQKSFLPSCYSSYLAGRFGCPKAREIKGSKGMLSFPPSFRIAESVSFCCWCNLV